MESKGVEPNLRAKLLAFPDSESEIGSVSGSIGLVGIPLLCTVERKKWTGTAKGADLCRVLSQSLSILGAQLYESQFRRIFGNTEPLGVCSANSARLGDG